MLLGINGHKALKYWQGQMDPLLEINASGLLNHHSQDVHAGHRLGRVSSKAHFEPHQWHLLAPLPPLSCSPPQQIASRCNSARMLPKPAALPGGPFYIPAVAFLMLQPAFPCCIGFPAPHRATSIACTACLSPWCQGITGQNKVLLPCPAASPLPADVQHGTLGKLHLPPELQKGQQ